MIITLAFYKGRANNWWYRLQDDAIRYVTQSPYSHVELIKGDATKHGIPYLCWSSSGRDGGVRKKNITLREGQWDMVKIQMTKEKYDDILNKIGKEQGKSYDYAGILLSQIFAFGRHSKRRWFCSELIAYAMGIEQPERFSPGMLYNLVKMVYK